MLKESKTQGRTNDDTATNDTATAARFSVDSYSLTTARSSVGYNKHIASKWKQECIPALNGNWKLSRLFTALFLIGIPLIAIGIYLWTIRNTNYAYVYDYTDCISTSGDEPCATVIKINKYDSTNRNCTCKFHIDLKQNILGKVVINYQLEHFHQNLRRYSESLDVPQLKSPYNKDNSPKKPAKECNSRYSYSGDKRVIYPCGQIPNSMFTDVIALTRNNAEIVLQQFPFHADKFGYKNPHENHTELNFTKAFSKPRAWSTESWETFWKNGGVQSADFKYWMKVSAFYNFRNPYRFFDGNIPSCLPLGVEHGFCSGQYLVTIKGNVALPDFDVKSARGRKKIEISSASSAIVDQSCFLSISCTAVGSVTVLLGLVCLIKFLLNQRAKKLRTSYSSRDFTIEESLGDTVINDHGGEPGPIPIIVVDAPEDAPEDTPVINIDITV